MNESVDEERKDEKEGKDRPPQFPGRFAQSALVAIGRPTSNHFWSTSFSFSRWTAVARVIAPSCNPIPSASASVRVQEGNASTHQLLSKQPRQLAPRKLDLRKQLLLTRLVLLDPVLPAPVVSSPSHHKDTTPHTNSWCFAHAASAPFLYSVASGSSFFRLAFFLSSATLADFSCQVR